MSYAIKHLFHISVPRDKVYEALTSIDALSKWWTADTSGSSDPGEVIRFRFNGQGPDMKVTELKPRELVAWKCVADPYWLGNKLTFALDENDGKTRLRFSHDGWQEQNDFYAICTFAWGRYMESLRQYCQAGKSQGFGQPDYQQ